MDGTWWLRLAVSLALTCLGVTSSALAVKELPWHRDWAKAQAAALQTKRLILVYVYQHNLAPCVEMEQTTFQETEVVEAMGSTYELFAVDGAGRRQRDFLEKYRVGVQTTEEEETETNFGTCPAYLLLAADGHEYYRGHGYIPPIGFLGLLANLKRLVDLTDRWTQNPNDAQLNAELGHLHLEMERPEAGKPLLEQAVKLDPDNKLGVHEEAAVDLAIIAIADQPQASFRHLMTYQMAHPGGPRHLEVAYYLAVAQLAMGNYEAAEEILRDFEAITPFLPDGETPNPDYRSPWTEQADILLQQLRRLMTTTPTG